MNRLTKPRQRGAFNKAPLFLAAGLSLFFSASVSADLIGLYTFDDPADLYKDDSSANNTLASVSVDPTASTAGIEGGAAEFDGTQRLIVPIDISPTATPNATIGAWVKTANLDAGLRKVLGSDDGGWDRTMGLDDRNDTFRYTAFTGNGPLVGTPGPVSTDDWTFLAVTFDEPNQTLTVYVDVDSSTTDDVPVAVSGPTSFGTGPSSVSIGTVGPASTGEGWLGEIDNVFFFNETLDAGQIRLIRDGKKAALTGALPVTDPAIALGTFEPIGTLPNKPGPRQRTITLSNKGATQALTLSDVSFSGPEASAFSVVSSPSSIPAGGTADVVVSFDPGSASGAFSATLEIASNDFGTPVATVAFAAKVSGGLIAENLLGFYTFDDPANPLLDSSGRENTLTLLGGAADPVYGANTGIQGGAYTFNGSNRMTGPINLDPTEVPELTIGAWVKTSTLDPGLRKILGTDNGGWDRTIGLDNRNDVLRYTAFTGDGPLVGTPGPESTAAWTFLAVTFDENNKALTVYVDTDVATLSDELVAVSGPTVFGAGAATFSVGTVGPGNAGEGWQGEIDNLFIIPGVLSKEQLDGFRSGGRSAIENYGFGPPRDSLIAFYNFDNAEKPLDDASGNGKTLDPVAPPTYAATSGFEGGAYRFDGGQRFVADIDINPDVVPQLTVGAWVKPSDLSPGLKKILGSDDGGWDRTIGLDNRDGDFRYTAFVGNQRPVVGTPGPVNTEDWSFLAVVFDETTSEVTVYVDLNAGTTGDPLVSVSEPTAFGTGYNQISIGSLTPANASEGWFGQLDNVFLYKAALTETQLSYLRDGGSAAILGVTGDDPDLGFDLAPLFGTLANRDPITKNLSIQNAGRTQALDLTTATIIGRDAAYYSVTNFPASLAPGASGQIEIAFDPTGQTGDFVAQLRIESNDESLPITTINLGATTPPPSVADPLISGPVISPFGVLVEGQHVRSITLRNTGSAKPLTLSSLAVDGKDAANYQLGALPGPIAPGGSGSVEVTFDSAGDFGRFSAKLIVTSDSASGRFTEISLDANVPITDPAAALIGFYSFDDPGNPLKDNSDHGLDLVQEDGTEPTLLPDGGFEGGGAFQFDGGQHLIAPIDINTSVIPELTMGAWVKPSDITPGLRKIIGHDNGGWDRTIGLDDRNGPFRYIAFTGQGVTLDTPEPVNTDDWTFIAVTYDQPNNEVTLYVDVNASTLDDTPVAHTEPTAFNSGFSTLSIGNLGPNGTSEAWLGLIDKVFFFDAVLDATTIKDIRDGGILPGSQDPNLRTSGGFGDLGNNVSPVTRTLTIRNGGQTNMLNITGTRLTGPDAANFTLLGALPASIAPGEAATLDVRLDPQGRQGGFIAFLEIDSNDPGDPTVVVDLSGLVSNGNGILAHYKMDETSGTGLLDASGHGHHGQYTATDGGTFTLGQPGLAGGTAVAFSDTTDSGAGYAIIPASSAPGPLSPFTVSMWVNESADDSGVSTLFAKGEGAGDPFAVASLNGALVWFSASEQGFSVDNALTPGVPHHVVTTYEVVNDVPTATFFVDGAQVGSSTVAAFNDTTASIFQIGTLNGTFGFTGRIDDVQLYSKALSAAEVTSLFATPGVALAGDSPPVAEPTVFRVGEVTKGDGTVGLTFDSEAGKAYVIEYSQTLEGDWVEVQTVNGQAGSTAFSDSDATRVDRPLGFYRVRVN